jgi:hypothetical protein
MWSAIMAHLVSEQQGDFGIGEAPARHPFRRNEDLAVGQRKRRVRIVGDQHELPVPVLGARPKPFCLLQNVDEHALDAQRGARGRSGFARLRGKHLHERLAHRLRADEQLFAGKALAGLRAAPIRGSA